MTDAAAAITAADDELQAWREVHAHLSKAVLVAQEAVAVAKTNRRYWLEEICANVTPEGKLINTSCWKKSGKSTRKPAAKRKTATASGTKAKRQRKQQVPNEASHFPVAYNFPVPPQPIMPNDAAGMAAMPPQMYADLSNGEDRPQMSPMQAAQSSSFPAPSNFVSRGKVLPPMRGKVLPQPHMRGKVLPTNAMAAPYSAAQQAAPVPHVPVVPNANPMGAYASVLQAGDDSDDTESDEDDD
jgi:hypothetical protein